jgi:hypothetical protein
LRSRACCAIGAPAISSMRIACQRVLAAQVRCRAPRSGPSSSAALSSLLNPTAGSATSVGDDHLQTLARQLSAGRARAASRSLRQSRPERRIRRAVIVATMSGLRTSSRVRRRPLFLIFCAAAVRGPVVGHGGAGEEHIAGRAAAGSAAASMSSAVTTSALHALRGRRGPPGRRSAVTARPHRPRRGPWQSPCGRRSGWTGSAPGPGFARRPGGDRSPAVRPGAARSNTPRRRRRWRSARSCARGRHHRRPARHCPGPTKWQPRSTQRRQVGLGGRARHICWFMAGASSTGAALPVPRHQAGRRRGRRQARQAVGGGRRDQQQVGPARQLDMPHAALRLLVQKLAVHRVPGERLQGQRRDEFAARRVSSARAPRRPAPAGARTSSADL